MSALNDGAVVSDMLDALATRLDGSPAAPDYFARRRRVMHRVLAYAVRKKRLDKNPLSKANLPEGWTPPEKPEEAIDPRSVGSPELVAGMLTVTSYVGRRQGPRFVAFFGCMFYAMMRPAEVTSLTKDGCHLPETGWGRLIFSDSSPAAGREFTDDGRVHDDRGLKGRDRQGRARTRTARARRATRNVPIPPELVALLRQHLEQFGPAPAGACSAARTATRSSRPPTGGSGRRPGPWPSPHNSSAPRCCTAPTTCATPASPGGSTPASQRPRSPPGPGTASRCSCVSTPAVSLAWKTSGSPAWTPPCARLSKKDREGETPADYRARSPTGRGSCRIGRALAEGGGASTAPETP